MGASGAAVVTAATIEAQAIPGVTTIPPALAAAAVQAQSQFPELPFTVFSGPAAAQTADGASGGSVFAGDMTGADNVGQAHYASYGWYIVPSIGNDPGYADAAIETAGEWGFADAGYEGGDWFFLA